ncbi:TPA: hypothetical protein DEP58_04715 [Patescibacteria group bacterium]|nr:MAG: hypothetical protein UU98_C0044G0009 [Parcubacteria group bacterium GW2011_GWD2_42_14]HCC05568.1 hypothetical protein [Patescibacteria group bacterium]
MPKEILPAIYDALIRAEKQQTETILEIEGLRWSPRGVIHSCFKSETPGAVRIYVKTEDDEHIVYTFQGNTVLGVGTVVD